MHRLEALNDFGPFCLTDIDPLALSNATCAELHQRTLADPRQSGPLFPGAAEACLRFSRVTFSFRDALNFTWAFLRAEFVFNPRAAFKARDSFERR